MLCMHVKVARLIPCCMHALLIQRLCCSLHQLCGLHQLPDHLCPHEHYEHLHTTPSISSFCTPTLLPLSVSFFLCVCSLHLQHSTCTVLKYYGEGTTHDPCGHQEGVHHGGSPAGQAEPAEPLRQLLPHPHLPAAHLHHRVANVSWRRGQDVGLGPIRAMASGGEWLGVGSEQEAGFIC